MRRVDDLREKKSRTKEDAEEGESENGVKVDEDVKKKDEVMDLRSRATPCMAAPLARLVAQVLGGQEQVVTTRQK